MRLQFLGTGGYHSNSRRQTAGLLLAECGILLDAGSGLYRLMERVESPELEIFLTHAHLDHVQGLTYLLVPLEMKTLTRCCVHAQPQVLDVVRTHLFSPGLFPIAPRFDYAPLAEETRINGVLITFRPLKHPGGSCGYQLTFPDGKRLAYITDTTVDGSYTEWIRGADVLIHECYFSDDLTDWCEVTGHSSTSMVATLAKDADVGRLYLTHIDPLKPVDDPVGLEVARAIFPQTFLAEDLLTIEI